MNQAQTLAEPASPSSAAALPLTIEASKPDAGSGPSLSIRQAIFWAAVSIACFHLAYGFQALSILIIGYVFGLAQLTRVSSTRLAMWLGFGAGFLTAAPQLTCFWTLFGPGAIALWSVLGFWIALFVVVGRFTMRRLGIAHGWWLLPIIWTGLEYFRSELYFLKFTWLNVGYTLAGSLLQPVLHYTGGYGAGFLAMAIPLAIWLRSRVALGVALVVALIGFAVLIAFSSDSSTRRLAPPIKVAGVQLEFPTEADVVVALDRLIAHHPEAELVMLSEYTFMEGAVPQNVRNWCRDHRKYLLAGGKHLAKPPDFYDTAFVVGPSGDIVFEQGKCVPVQFMKDGLPATSQHLWQSPWGKVGICICYDLSYTRVTDRLVQLGAQALLIPTMDVVDWGRHEHELHARVAPVRATEYGVPVFRVASSGISQFVDSSGKTIATAGYPGDHEEIFGTLAMAEKGTSHIPGDRWLALLCVAISGGLVIWLIFTRPRIIAPARIAGLQPEAS